ncbi:MAG: 4-hydroxyphenylpyruvate dioxygenase [Betaproteobacteria bacterium]|jgi:4-hydroxyphenylpyruvate dioxygenase|nr:4-hydroxyphenylpyruvate dioxygenase [Betaproteobacteria bacterium]NBP44138.1 4-hydroxyphenylpyruvate dioxygenase [Betaproteobacteria bacterium]
MPINRESLDESPNPIGMAGVEFIEYSTTKPQALGQVLELMGFKPVARHRSREVMLYRQGDINLIVNAHEATQESPSIAAVAFRVRDAASAYRRALDLGAWAVHTQVEVMELNIPAVHGVGNSRIYFVDRHQDFSIYDVDFIPIPAVAANQMSDSALSVFGLVQYIGNDRTEDWTEFYNVLFGFQTLPDDLRFGILPKGRILRSPCGQFHIQLIEPEPGVLDVQEDEHFHRLGLGTQHVIQTVKAMEKNGVEFVDSAHLHTAERGALTTTWMHSLSFELVHKD